MNVTQNLFCLRHIEFQNESDAVLSKEGAVIWIQGILIILIGLFVIVPLALN